MIRRNFLRAIAFSLAVFMPMWPAAAENSAVRTAVNQFMRAHVDKLVKQLGNGTRIEYTVSSLDARLNLSDCTQPLTAVSKDSTQLSAHMNVQVGCPEVWSIYVPVELAIYRPVVTAVKPLALGSSIESDDVQLSSTDITQLSGQYLTALDDALGMSVVRSVAQGRPLTTQQLAPPLQIRRGEVVIINAESNVISVRMQGIALSDGRRGEQIRVKNSGSSRVISARVTGPGQVQAPM